jgi:hypothetical protein
MMSIIGKMQDKACDQIFILKKDLQSLRSQIRKESKELSCEQENQFQQITDLIILNSSMAYSDRSQVEEKSQKYIKNLQLNLSKCEQKIEALQS